MRLRAIRVSKLKTGRNSYLHAFSIRFPAVKKESIQSDPPIKAEPAFQHRSYYVNFASHLLNRWNVNVLFPGATNQWSLTEWRRLLEMVKAFGYTCFEYWVAPTLYTPEALQGAEKCERFARTMRQVTGIAHELGLNTKYIAVPNCIGHRWYFACPNVPEDLELIEKLWRYWSRELSETDIVGLFPGDPGGCNRNGCDCTTWIELALRMTDITLAENPDATIEFGTWGSPFSGWGDDMIRVPDWDGTWEQMTQTASGCHIWKGTPDRAERAMTELMRRLPEFPEDTMVAMNLGFSPESDPTVGGDARPYVRELSSTHRVNSWDYAVTEGELVPYPHWRIPRILARRREEQHTAGYFGATNYTMTPGLSHLCMYAGAQAAIDPEQAPDALAREFCRQVFGSEHEELGELMEAFEIVPGWGHHPRRRWSRRCAHRAYLRMIDHLESAEMTDCELPLFPSPEQYREDLLWFARQFAVLSGEEPKRDVVREKYWEKVFSIYDNVAMSVDRRARNATERFSRILTEDPPLIAP